PTDRLAPGDKSSQVSEFTITRQRSIVAPTRRKRVDGRSAVASTHWSVQRARFEPDWAWIARVAYGSVEGLAMRRRSWTCHRGRAPSLERQCPFTSITRDDALQDVL